MRPTKRTTVRHTSAVSVRAARVLIVPLVLVSAGCGGRADKAAAPPTTTSAATTTTVVHVKVPTNRETSAPTVRATPPAPSPPLSLAAYARALQAQPDLLAPHCSPPLPVDSVRDSAARFRRAAAAQARLHPPKAAAAAHTRLVAAERGYAAYFERLAAKLAALGDPRAHPQVAEKQRTLAAATPPPRDVARSFAQARDKLEALGVEPTPPPLAPSEYEQRVQQLIDAAGPPKIDETSDPDELRSELQAGGDRYVGTAHALERIVPPEDARSAHDELQQAFCSRGLTMENAALAPSLRAGAATVDAFNAQLKYLDTGFDRAFADFRDADLQIHRARR
jgi:hypothetical protein